MTTSRLRGVVRPGAFVAKEIAEVVRQPALLVVLVLAPFAILLVFGLGIQDDDPPLRTIFVAPDDPELAGEVERFAANQSGRLEIVGVTEDAEGAMARLRRGEIELVVEFPDRPEEQVLDGEPAVVEMHHDQIDPVETRAVELYTALAVDRLNEQVVVSALEEGERQREAVDVSDVDTDSAIVAALLGGDVEPEVVASPFEGAVSGVDDAGLEMADFYAPAVVVVLLQHLMVTFLAMSFVRERQLGVHELYRLSPLQPGEIVAGKYVAHGLVGAVVIAALTAALVFVMGVPMLGSWWALTGVLTVTLLACAAAGQLIALLARSDFQAVQYAMMLLLATVFLGGFLVSLERLVPAVRWLSWLLPATHGIEATRDVMLRGRVDGVGHVAALATMTVVFTAAAWWMTHRRLRQGA